MHDEICLIHLFLNNIVGVYLVEVHYLVMPRPTGIGMHHRILAFAEEGLTQRVIAQRVGITRATVNRILKRHQDTGSVDSGKSTGRPRISTA